MKDLLRQLPVPKVHEIEVDIVKRANKAVRVVDRKSVFYFDVEDTLRRVLCDPLLREKLDVRPLDLKKRLDSQKELRDSDFARDPLLYSRLQSAPVRFSDGNRGVFRVGDFGVTVAGELVMLTAVSAEADGALQLTCERWLTAGEPHGKRAGLGQGECRRTREQRTLRPASITKPARVVGAAEKKSALEGAAAGQPSFWSWDDPVQAAAPLRVLYESRFGSHLVSTCSSSSTSTVRLFSTFDFFLTRRRCRFLRVQLPQWQAGRSVLYRWCGRIVLRQVL